ncbi:MAG: zf-HC2 domain-containing protein [Bacteroidetes bacterium]|nr:zf-HC2 domain-containing protein [Bacteroidota bacterium]
MSKRECKICDGRLPDYVDGKLDAEESRMMREHLSTSSSCAAEERELREFFSGILTRDIPGEGISDPGRFLVGVNAGIDRNARGYRPVLRHIGRPALFVPLFSTAVLLIIAAIVLFPSVETLDSQEALFSGLFNENDLLGIADLSPTTPMLDDIMIFEQSANRELISEEASSASDASSLNTAIDLTLLDDVPYSAVVSASLNYLSQEDVLEKLSDAEAESIVRELEQQKIRIL